ncbi:MAG: hypothetical protein GWN54_00125, partial [Gammaproteobacteria bacterium]|nr:hypothetical protein [Gammaproteobacteria bacterium]NIV19083.1 hypothetical protein [Gammaproteobacteria bacterium]NIW37770.1 hypothetical protein [Gemmatimonadota bacterium]
MKKRIATLVTLLALPALLVLAGTAWGQQDTTRAAPGIRARRGAHAGMMGRGFGAGGLRMAAHAGPRVLLHLKGELELSDEQVRRL